MTPTLFAALALALAAPKLKDPPKPPVPPLTGKWEVVSWVQGGAEMAFVENTVHEYTPDGKRILNQGGTVEAGRTYQLQPKADPPAVDLTRKLGDATDHFRAIYKIEKDTLTLCIGRPAGDRPTAFESTDENGWILMTFKRAGKKE